MAVSLLIDPFDSWIVRIVQEREEVHGYRTQSRVYEMANGDVLEVVWSGEDKHVCFNAYVPVSVGFAREMHSQQRRSGKGGMV